MKPTNAGGATDIWLWLSLAILILFFRWSGGRRRRKAERLMAMEKASSSANP